MCFVLPVIIAVAVVGLLLVSRARGGVWQNKWFPFDTIDSWGLVERRNYML